MNVVYHRITEKAAPRIEVDSTHKCTSGKKERLGKVKAGQTAPMRPRAKGETAKHTALIIALLIVFSVAPEVLRMAVVGFPSIPKGTPAGSRGYPLGSRGFAHNCEGGGWAIGRKSFPARGWVDVGENIPQRTRAAGYESTADSGNREGGAQPSEARA